jgi:hypothetical protein
LSNIPEKPEVITSDEEKDSSKDVLEQVEHPAKVMRIAAMIRQLLEEVRQANLDEASRSRLKEIYDLSVNELSSTLSEDLAAELKRISLPFKEDIPTDAEIRVAQAQLVGWLEGLFHGIQATLFAQQMAQRNQIEEMRRRGLPQATEQSRPGTYL